MKQTLNKKVYLTHGEILIILGLLKLRIEHLKEGDWNLVEQFMLNVVFIDIIKKLDPNNTQHILEIINDSFDKKEETITGVLTAPPTKPRSVAELVIELYGHPDYVGGTIFTKDDIMETITSDLQWSNDLYEEGEEEYMTDDEISDKAEQLYKLNYGRLNHAIHDICTDTVESGDFTDYMTYDLSKIQKTNSNE